MIRILTPEERLYCIEIMKSKNRIGGTLPITAERMDELGQNENIRYLGYFDNDKLVSWFCLSFHNTEQYGKFWVISGFYIVDQKEYFSWKRPEFGLLMEQAFKIAESHGYYKYYYCVGERINKVYERQWKKYKTNTKYEWHDIEVVPPNTQPESVLAWRLMGCELKPDNVYIKARILKGDK